MPSSLICIFLQTRQKYLCSCYMSQINCSYWKADMRSQKDRNSDTRRSLQFRTCCYQPADTHEQSYKNKTPPRTTKLGRCKKGKAIPLQAWSGPEGSRKLRFPDFMTTAQDGGKVVSLTHWSPLPRGNTPGIHFC